MSSIYAGIGEDDLVVGEGVALDLPAASFGPRLVSGAIDLAISYALLIAALMLMIQLAVDEALMSTMYVIALITVTLVFPTAIASLTRGKSVGKYLMGLRAVRDDGGPISFRHAFVRALVGVAELIMLGGVPALLCAVTNNKGKRFGDLVAGTYVVRDRAKLVINAPVQVPPHLAHWAATADIAPLPDALSVSLRHLAVRRAQVSPAAWASLVADLAARTRPLVSPPPPAGTTDQDFLAAVTAARRTRDLQRLANESSARQRLAVHAGLVKPDTSQPPSGSTEAG